MTIELRAPSRVEAGFSSTVENSTEIVTFRGGVERRNVNWRQGRLRFNSRQAAWDRESRAELLALARAVRGSAHAFLFKDWNDYSVSGQSLGSAPAGSATVQLVKTYTFGTEVETRIITRPIAATVAVFQNGSPKTVTVDETTGLITPTTSWTEGAVLTVNFEFLVPVRFASDSIEFVLPHREISEVSAELVEVIGE